MGHTGYVDHRCFKGTTFFIFWWLRSEYYLINPIYDQIYTMATWVYLILATCIKLTFLFLYRRIFSPQTTTKYFINGGIVFVACLNTGLLFSTIFMCSPVARSWNSALDGHCINPKVLPYFSGVTSFLTDIYILILPIPLLWRLNMGRKRKFRLAVIFGTGLL